DSDSCAVRCRSADIGLPASGQPGLGRCAPETRRIYRRAEHCGTCANSQTVYLRRSPTYARLRSNANPTWSRDSMSCLVCTIHEGLPRPPLNNRDQNLRKLHQIMCARSTVLSAIRVWVADRSRPAVFSFFSMARWIVKANAATKMCACTRLAV